MQSLNQFFFWRPSGFAALRVDRDKVGSLVDKIGSRVSLFISNAKSDLGPLASFTVDLCTILLSNLENFNKSFAIDLKQIESLACLFRISERRQRQTN